MILLERTWFKQGKWTQKRLKVQCPACGGIFIRYCWHSVTKWKTCGCDRSSTIKHGLAKKHPLYAVWQSMRDRCLNPKSESWADYGGRGIRICAQWREFRPFYQWAISHGWKSGKFMDRRRVNGNYTPGNCRFVSVTTSNRNRRFVKCSVEKARAVKGLLALGMTPRHIADSVGLSMAIISQIKARKSWKEV